MIKRSKRPRRLSHGLRGACAVALVFLLSVPVLATPNDICVPNISGGLTGVPLTTDGIIEGYTGPGGVSNDPGWEGAARVNLLDTTGPNMGTLAAAKFQVGRDASFVYLGFVVSTPLAGANDTIVVGLSTKAGDPATDWRFHIKPFDASTADPNFTGSSQTPNAVTFWRDSTQWNLAAPNPLPHTAAPGEWPHDNTRFSKSGNLWSLEMKIPITTDAGMAGGSNAIFFPASGIFRLYVNVLSTNTISNTTTQDPWPAGVIVTSGMSTFLTRNTPDVSQWGNASFNDRADCDGVSLSWDQIGVDNPAAPGTLISDIRRFDPPGAGTFTETEAQCQALAPDFQWPGSQGQPNTFVAKPLNNMAGTQAKVSATFRLANWGIPGTSEWTKLGEANPPLAPLAPLDVMTNPSVQQTINSGAQGNLIAKWTLSYRWSCLYKFRPHQCIQVDLDSNDPATRFKDKSAQRNMNFVPASRFEQRARISGNQGKLAPGQTEHQFIITVETDQQGQLEASKDARTATSGQQSRPRRLQSQELANEALRHFGRGVTNLGTWIARGSLRTGTTIRIGETEYEYVRRVGDFGYVAGHTGPISGWRFEFAGEGLKQLSESLYAVAVPPGGEAFVNTVIETTGGQDDRGAGGGGGQHGGGGSLPADADSKRWGLSLHAGASIPHADFANVFNPGPNFGVDLEYRLSNHLSLEALYGFHRFRGEDFGVVSLDDVNLHQLSGNVKVFGGSGAVRPFLNGGGGVYVFDFGGSGDTHGGLNVGGGLQFNLTPTFAVEGSYNFHNVFTSGSDVKFSTLQGGVRFRF
jgi:hypothetical protein